MSRGPGRIERAVRALFDAHPDLAFVTDELVEHCYPGAERVSDQPKRVAAIEARYARKRRFPLSDPTLAERVGRLDRAAAERGAGPGVLEFPPKYQVAVLRAAKKVIARDPDWSMHRSESQGGTWTFFNRANAQSWAMASVIGEWRTTYRSPKRLRRYDRADQRWDRWPTSSVLRDRDEALKLAPVAKYEKHVSWHVAHRDGDAATKAAMEAEDEARERAWIAAGQALMGGKRLEAASDAASKHIELAAKARRLITENDPDAIRAGLAEIADAFDSLSTGDP